MILRRLLPSIALFLSGCAGTLTGYPSLAKRPIENAPAGGQAAATVATTNDPALQAEVDKLVAQAQAGSASFEEAWPAADRASQAAKGSAVSSEAWVTAEQALSALESARNGTVSALASLDVLYVERNKAIADGKAQGGTEQIDAARAGVLTAVDSQNDRIDMLKARLAAP